MNKVLNLIQKVFAFESAPQKIGLSHLTEPVKAKRTEPSIKSKDIKLSDLMRRAS